MNAKPDRRVSKTRQALQNALVELILEKGYEALTIQDILDRANVGRSTFYSHFYDKDDLLESEFEKLHTDFERAFAENHKLTNDILSFSLVMFTHAKDFHIVYRAVVGKHGAHLMHEKIDNYLKSMIHAALSSQWTEEKDAMIPLDILENHLINSFIQLLRWWLDNDLPHSPERMDEIYRNLVGQLIEANG